MSHPPAPDPTPHDDSARIERLRGWFDAIVDVAPHAQDAWMSAHVSDPADQAALRALLGADAASGLLDESADARATRIGAVPDAHVDTLIGQRFGAFRLTRVLGRGGMSVVYLGERDDTAITQRAAVKVLRRGLHSTVEQRLFEREQKALAALSHPNIAYLIDGGLTDAGVAYLILEYVDGVTITQYAQSHALDPRALLALFVSICRAVAAAHRQLIVHRDLKPSNILVTPEGQVKLLDFGIAKLLEDEAELPTRTGFGALTPEYAAPEQLHGEAVTTSTDVYALGIVLHEMLIGERPDGDDPLARRPSSRLAARANGGAATATGVPKLAAMFAPHELRGDLDNILQMALALEPERRYRSAAELADDVQRHLDGLPVLAHPPSRWYRTRKFVARHRGGVLLGTIASAAVLASIVLTAWQANVAQREAAKANLVRDFVVEIFESARTSIPRDQRPTPEMLVEQAATRLNKLPGIDPATRIDLLRTLGSVWLSLSDFAAADTAFAEAAALAEARGDHDDAQRLAVARAIGWQQAGRNAEASAALTAAFPALDRIEPSRVPRALAALAAALFETGRIEQALQASARSTAAAAKSFGDDSIDHLAARIEHGALLSTMERHREAIAKLDPALDRWRALGGPDDDRFLRGLKSFAASSRALGAADDSEGLFRELLELHRRLYVAPHHAIAASLRDLASVLVDEDRHDEALALVDEALAMQRAVLSPEHVQQVMTLDLRGYIHASRRNFTEAEAAYAEALSICERAALVSESCSRVHNNRGQNFYRQNRLPEAEQQMRLALAQRRERFGEDHMTIAVSLSTLGNILDRAGRFDEALVLQQDALGSLSRLGMADTAEYALVNNSLAQSLHGAARHADALQTIDAALALWRSKMPESQGRELSMLVLKARILIALSRPDTAREVANAAIALNVERNRLNAREIEVLRAASGRADLYR